MIASPVYGAVDPAFYASMLRLQRRCWEEKIDLQIPLLTADSLVTRARDRYVQWFMRSDCDRLCWIDSDIGFDADDLIRLARKPWDFVCGAYPCKGFDSSQVKASTKPFAADLRYVVNMKPMYRKTTDGCIEVHHAGTGFMIWSRKVAETLVAGCASEPYKNSSTDAEWHYPVFKTPVVDGLLLSEDYHVCNEWQKSGGQVWVDPSVKLTHSGRFTFEGDFGEWLRNKE